MEKLTTDAGNVKTGGRTVKKTVRKAPSKKAAVKKTGGNRATTKRKTPSS